MSKENQNLALIFSDTHGILEREQAAIAAVKEHADRINYVIMNGDIAAGQHLGRIQNAFYRVKNPLKTGDTKTATESLPALIKELTDLGVKPQNLGSPDAFLAVVDEAMNYGTFQSWVCGQSPGLLEILAQDVLDGVKRFILELRHACGDNVSIIYNTGNWEDTSPLDFDGVGLSFEENRPLPHGQRIGRKIEQLCGQLGITYNDGCLSLYSDGHRLTDTVILGAKAIIDMAEWGGEFNPVRAGRIIAHYPLNYWDFDYTPSGPEEIASRGLERWVSATGASELWHGHLHRSAERHYITHSIHRTPVFSHLIASEVGGYALVNL